MKQLLKIIANTNKTALQVLQEFTEAQLQSWPLAATNYKNLEKVKVKQFQFDGFQVKVQFCSLR